MSVTNTAAASGPSQALLNAVNPKSSTSATGVEADKDKFMTLLITQLKNQDPLNPLDNAQVTSQLAQLQTVTGVNKLNETLESLKASYQSSETLSATNMINHGVLTEGKGIVLSEGKAIFGVDLGSPADKVQVNIFNASGKLVHTMDLGDADAGTQAIGWDGKQADGTALESGKYSFTVTAKQGDKTLADAKALTFGLITSVSTNASGAKLNTSNGDQVTMADVKQIL